MNICNKEYDYRPLPIGMSILDSSIHGNGLFTSKNIPIFTNIGISHYLMEDGNLIRTPLGGFINHSETPNCEILPAIDGFYTLNSIVDIQKGDEITVNYNKSICGQINSQKINKTLSKLKYISKKYPNDIEFGIAIRKYIALNSINTKDISEEDFQEWLNIISEQIQNELKNM